MSVAKHKEPNNALFSESDSGILGEIKMTRTTGVTVVAEPSKKSATYDDLYTMPENMTREIIDGELIVTPKPSRKHAYAICAQHEMPHLWLVDPVRKTLEVYRLQSGSWTVAGMYAEDDKIRAEPFHEVEIDLASLWWEAWDKGIDGRSFFVRAHPCFHCRTHYFALEGQGPVAWGFSPG
jgi:hypothetical protein